MLSVLYYCAGKKNTAEENKKMTEGAVQSIRSIESSPHLSQGAVLEHAFKVNNDLQIPFAGKEPEATNLQKEKSFGITPAMKSLIPNSILLNMLIRNPRLLAIVSKYPRLIGLILNNPALINILELRPALMGVTIANPRILSILASRPDLLTLVANSPQLLTLLRLNSSLLNLLTTKPWLLAVFAKSESLLNMVIMNPELLTKRKVPTPRFIIKTQELEPLVYTSTELISKQSEPNKLPPRTKTINKSLLITPDVIPVQMPIGKKISELKTGILSSQVFRNIQKLTTWVILPLKPLIIKLMLFIGKIFQKFGFTLNPALLVQLGAIAVTTSKGRIIQASGNIEELETQTERQLTTQSETGPIHEVEGASEVHLTKGTIA